MAITRATPGSPKMPVIRAVVGFRGIFSGVNRESANSKKPPVAVFMASLVSPFVFSEKMKPANNTRAAPIKKERAISKYSIV